MKSLTKKVKCNRENRDALAVVGYIGHEMNIPYGIIIIIYDYYHSSIMTIYFDGNGDESLDKRKFTKNTLENITDVFINRANQYFIAKEQGIMYAFGDNNYGQLGLSHKDTTGNICKIMHKNPYFVDNKACLLMSQGCKNEHVFVYTINNELYGFGATEKCQVGCTRYDDEDTIVKPTLINIDFKIKQIAAGFAHTLFTSING